MKRTLLAALTTLALVGCSHANKDTATASAGGADEQTESVAHSADERVQAQESREASDQTVYDGPSATGGSGADVVTDPNTGEATPVDNAPNQGIHPTDTATKDDPSGAAAATDGAGNMATRSDGSGTGGSGSDVQARSEVTEEEGTGGSGAMDPSTSTTHGTGTGGSAAPCPDPGAKKK